MLYLSFYILTSEKGIDLAKTKTKTKAEEEPTATGIVNTEHPHYLEAQFRKITIPSTDVGTYDKDSPTITPDVSDTGLTIEDFEKLYWTNPLVHKAINIKANRVIGDGFELIQSSGDAVEESVAEDAKDLCEKFLDKIKYVTFFRQSLINSYCAGNEWTEVIYNKLENMVNLTHGDFKTIDFRRSLITNKILLGLDGEPEGFWQYIQNLAELYQNIMVLFGSEETLENLQATKVRLEESAGVPVLSDGTENKYEIQDTTGIVRGVLWAKPQYIFLEKKEIVHLSLNNLNDNFYGTSLILAAYDSLIQLKQIQFATAEYANTLGYPKPVCKVGDELHSPSEKLNNLAEKAIEDPVRKEGYVIPYYMDLSYLVPPNTAADISSYPEWFVTAVSIGLRVPKELLTGEGDANRATSLQASSDFEKDNEADRRQLEGYIYRIFELLLEDNNITATHGLNPYIPKIRWARMITEDEKIREDMILAKWEKGLINFGEAREQLKLNEINDEELNAKFYLEPTKENPFAKYDPEQTSSEEPIGQEAEPDEGTTQTDEEVLKETAQHKLDPKSELNPSLNKQFDTEDVDYKKVAQKKVGTKIKTVNKTKAKQIRDTLVNGMANKERASQIKKDIKKIGKYEDYEVDRIVRTENKNLRETADYENAIKEGYTHKRWKAILDTRTTALSRALNGQVRKVNEDFEATFTNEQGKKEHWKGKLPPEEINSRCRVLYFKKGDK